MAINKEQIIQDTIAQIRKALPNATIGRYSEYGNQLEVECLTTGSLAADSVLGGGWPKGRISCVVGHTSSGKTTLALTACADLQKEKKAKGEKAYILYCDSEQAIDPNYARTLGVDMDDIFLIQPDTGEEGYQACEMFINSGVADLVIVDSIAAMIPKAMFEVELGEQAQIGMGARLDSQGIARLFGPANKFKTTVILINQWKKAVKTNAYDRTDGISGNYYMPGGETLKFYFSILAEVQRVGKVYEKDENGIEQLVSNQTRIRVLKNKIAPPGREADYFLTFDRGIDQEQECIELGLLTGDVEKVGRQVYRIAGEEQGFNGRGKFVEYLRENPEKVEIIRKNVKEKYIDKQRGERIHLNVDGEDLSVKAPDPVEVE